LVEQAVTKLLKESFNLQPKLSGSRFPKEGFCCPGISYHEYQTNRNEQDQTTSNIEIKFGHDTCIYRLRSKFYVVHEHDILRVRVLPNVFNVA